MSRRKTDPLKTYRQKRHFDVTSEPSGVAKGRSSRAAPDAPTFMVHKHDATRLHYDLRLEMDGALASWAIPKGPSYDPADKRLAVQTEDHPLEYGGFEGRIPEGEYGAGDSIIWDRGTYDTVPPGQASAQRKKGHLHIRLEGDKLKGEWHLIRTRPLGGKAQWLIFKAKDGTERAGYDVVAERPESVKSGKRVTRGPVRKKTLRAIHVGPDALIKKVWPPMKATLSTVESASEKTHVFEVKYDGFRAVAAISGGRLALESRNGKDFALRFPELTPALVKLPVAEAVLDGEIVALDADGVSHFESMSDPKAKRRFVVFDILWLDGEDLRGRPLEERRDLLESVLANAKAPLMIAERVEGKTRSAMALAKRNKLEGLIAKERGSVYENSRSEAWLKLKVTGSQEVAIVGFTPISNGRREIGALLVGVHDRNGYRYAGKVGTGFSTKIRRELLRLLRAQASDTPTVRDAPRVKGATWVKPTLVAQVGFSEWTRDGKLRHPRFEGLRDDKAPREVVQEKARTSHHAAGERRAPTLKAARHARAPAKLPDDVDVPITHPERVIFPKSKLTKADVAGYYREVAPYLLPALADRPLSFQAWPRGITQPPYFSQSAKNAPDFIHRENVRHADHDVEHIIVDRPSTLLWLANQSALTLHMTASRLATIEEADWVAFDLDPAASGWEPLVPIAHALRGLLEELKLKGYPKTSGKRGLHVVVPVARGVSHEAAEDFAVKITEVLARKFPKTATTLRPLTERNGRLYLDAHQNGRLKTIVAPYSLRAMEGAPASTPLEWDEVTTRLDPGAFNLKTLPKRLEKVGDLFAPALRGGKPLPRLL